MKKRWAFMITGLFTIGMAAWVFLSGDKIESASGMLVNSCKKIVALGTPAGNRPAPVAEWANDVVSCVENYEITVDYEKLYVDMGTAVVTRLAQDIVKDELENFGITVDTKEDGSTTYEDSNGNAIVRNEDGTWDITISNDAVAQLDGEWPDNEYTKQVPKPEFQPTKAVVDESSFSVAFLGIGVSELRQYVETLKAEGFTVNPVTEDVELFGMMAYSYTASNDAGYRVNVTYAMDMCGMTITKE